MLGTSNPPTGKDAPYKLDKAVIINDLSKERPQWILSSYGPAQRAPLQLFGGHLREQSFEELRARHYELAAQGNPQQAVQEAQISVNNAEQQIQTALNDVDGAIKYIINGENEHPNRNDICKALGAPPAQPQMAGPSQQSTSTFGQPSNPAPVFGQPSAPSAFGRPSGSTLGQASATVSTFGQPSTTSFGQPSALGRPTTSFGQPSSPFGNSSTSAPTFGQTSAPSPFGAPTQPQNSSPFGAATGSSANPQANQGGSPFGQQSTPVQPSPFGQQPAPIQSSPFGRTSVPTQPSPFTQASAPTQPSVFGKPPVPASSSPFGHPTASATPGGSTQTSTAPNPFGQPSAPQTTSTFGQPSGAAPNPFDPPKPAPIASGSNVSAHSITNPQPANSAQAQKDTQQKLRHWNGKPVSYIDEEPYFKGVDGNWQRIWFPNGPPLFSKTAELPEEVYDEATKEKYKYLKQHGKFENGIMPVLPPRREWCSWNF